MIILIIIVLFIIIKCFHKFVKSGIADWCQLEPTRCGQSYGYYYLTAVSYTHLDVYKRQTLNRSPCVSVRVSLPYIKISVLRSKQ